MAVEELSTHARVREILERSQGKKALVLGGGITGVAVSELLANAGYPVTVVDERRLSAEKRALLSPLVEEIIENYDANSDKGKLFSGKEFAFAVVSPGISLESPFCAALSQAGIPKLSELDFGVAYLGMPEVAVTGTNGKSTTVTLIHQILTHSGVEAALVGNIGKPFVSLIDPEQLGSSKKKDSSLRLVAEVSSYQLESAVDFTPSVGVWLNIDEDHLERHGTLEEYLRVKSRIFSGQNAERDWSLICENDEFAPKMKSMSCGRYFPFGIASESTESDRDGCFFYPNQNEVHFRLDGSSESYKVNDYRLIGMHNMVNLSAAIASARLTGVESDAVRRAIPELRPLAHRLEIVRELDGVLFINDSKATNVSAASVALDAVLEEFKRSRVILLLGGQAKRSDWAALGERITLNTRTVLTFGRDGNLVADEIEPFLTPKGGTRWSFRETQLERLGTLEQAVSRGAEIGEQGDIVLLAPACASFDAYPNFEVRGDEFKRLVERLS